MNTKAKGTRFENDVVHFFRGQGRFAMRAPASLGIDVIVYHKPHLFGLECTTEQCMRSRKVRKLRNSCKEHGMIPVYCMKIPRSSVPKLVPVARNGEDRGHSL